MAAGPVPGLPGHIPRGGELSSGGTRVPKEAATAEVRSNLLPRLGHSKGKSKPRPVPLVWGHVAPAMRGRNLGMNECDGDVMGDRRVRKQVLKSWLEDSKCNQE